MFDLVRILVGKECGKDTESGGEERECDDDREDD